MILVNYIFSNRVSKYCAILVNFIFNSINWGCRSICLDENILFESVDILFFKPIIIIKCISYNFKNEIVILFLKLINISYIENQASLC